MLGVAYESPTVATGYIKCTLQRCVCVVSVLASVYCIVWRAVMSEVRHLFASCDSIFLAIVERSL